MKKTSKKVVSLLTILSFLLTLVPAAVFAEPAQAADPTVKITAPAAGAAVAPGEVNVTVDSKDIPAGQKVFVGVAKDDAIVNPVEVKDGAAKVTVAKGDTQIGAVISATDGTDAAPTATVDINVTEDPALLNGVSAQHSIINIDEDYTDVTVNEEVKTKVELAGAVGGDVAPAKYSFYVWAETTKDQLTDALKVEDNDKITAVQEGNAWKVTFDEPLTEAEFNLKFATNGKYKVYASLVNPAKEDAPEKVNDKVVKFASDRDTVNVSIDDTVTTIGVKSINSPAWDKEVLLKDGEVLESLLPFSYDANGVKHFTKCGVLNAGANCGKEANPDELAKLPKAILVDPNGTTQSKVEATIYNEENGKLVKAQKGVEVTFDTNSANITVDPVSDKTDRSGKVTFNITGKYEGQYNVYIKAGNTEVIVPVYVTPLRAEKIVKVSEPENPLATGEAIDDQLKFQILDPNGNALVVPFVEEKPGTTLMYLGLDGLSANLDKSLVKRDLQGNYTFEVTDRKGYKGDFITLEKPAASKLKIKDLSIKATKDGYFYVQVAKNAKQLVAGDYAVTVKLDNGRSITFNWTMKDFKTAQELIIDYGVNNVELNGITDAPDVYFLDENKVKKDALKYVELGANGYAIKHFDNATGVVQVENNEKYLGDKIEVFAIAPREGLTAKAELTVTKGGGSLEFGNTNGVVAQANRVPFKLVDSEGKALNLGADKRIINATAVVVSQSNKDAKITANVPAYSYDKLRNGEEGTLNLTSDKATTAEIKVTVTAKVANKREGYSDAYTTQVYSGVVNYNFGTNAENMGRMVVMTIGSKDTIVNNKVVTIDAAPFVNADMRTMVPFRALAEDFGATVEWNEKDRTITTELDGVKVVMTVDKKEYTVNGEEKVADTAPVIQGDRTLVPVRFVTEALGFKVTPTYDASNGATKSVLFSK